MNALAKRLQVWHAAIVVIWLVLPQFFAAMRIWPLYLLIPLAGYALTVYSVPLLRRSVTWLQYGRSDWQVFGVTLAIIVLASAALVLWDVLMQPDLRVLTDQLREFSFVSLILLGITFSIFNALLEEVLFRGIFYEALDAEYGLWPAILIQGVLFGIVHAQGFPRGAVGVAMAGIYGILLGWLRHFSRGLLWPFIAHVFADATIFLLLMHNLGYRLV